MKTLNISISDEDFEQLGIKSTSISFSEFIEVVKREMARERLDESVELAEKYGLSSMTMEEITEEVKAVRANAKSRH